MLGLLLAGAAVVGAGMLFGVETAISVLDDMVNAAIDALNSASCANANTEYGETGTDAQQAFMNITGAHAIFATTIVGEFNLNSQGCMIGCPYYGCNCYEEALMELGGNTTVDEVREYAEELAEAWAEDMLNGAVWIPEDILNWAFYEVSDHH